MEDFGARPKVPARSSHTHKIPSSPVRLPSPNCETAHSRLPPPIPPKPRQSGNAVEYDDILTAKQYNMEYDDIITAKQYKHSKLKKCFTLPHVSSSAYGPLPSAHVPQDSKTVGLASIYPPKPLQKSKKSVGSGSTIIPLQKYATLPNTRSTRIINEETEQNMAYLQSLGCSDMLHLLDRMNLGQHKDSFKQEQVDGTLFTKLTATDLGELGITKSIHQKRLLSLIDGTVSARKFIGSKTSCSQEDEEEGYVIMSL